jgi:hypothetical protein
MENKFIILPDKSRQTTKTKQDLKQINTQKEKKVRVIAQTDKWQQVLQSEYYTSQMQNDILTSQNTELPIYKMMIQQIQQKINGYKYQDMKKNIYIPDSFVTLSDTLQLLDSSQMKCFYCETQVCIWYEFAREPKQWTLERIDNKYGHTRENVEIACLSCNLKRRTMYHERYVFTKKMKIVKQSEFSLEIIKQT